MLNIKLCILNLLKQLALYYPYYTFLHDIYILIHFGILIFKIVIVYFAEFNISKSTDMKIFDIQEY